MNKSPDTSRNKPELLKTITSEKLIYNSNMKKREKYVNVKCLIMSESLFINVKIIFSERQNTYFISIIFVFLSRRKIPKTRILRNDSTKSSY